MGLADLLRRRGLVPTISETERAALEAGTVWLDGELFSGRPDWRRILAEPYPQLDARERAFLDGPVEEVCRLLDPWRVEQERALPPEVWTYLKQEGFFGLQIPEEYGGHGFSTLLLSAVFAKLVTRSMYLSSVVLIPNSVGPGELLLEYGTAEQQQYYLPRLARGEEIPCFALTEPQAGSDAASLTSRGRVFRHTDGDLRIRLDFDKRYITLAPVATLIGLAVQLEDPENLLDRAAGQQSDLGITCVLVPATAPGVEIGRHHDPMGIPFPNGPIRGRAVEVGIDAIIGGPRYAGKGWRMLMEALSGGRAVSLPAQATGGAWWTARVVGAYAAIRHQFGLPIGRFEGVAEPLARIAGTTYLMDAARVFTCGALDGSTDGERERPSVISALMKYNLTELGRGLMQDGMDVLGGAGICRGPSNLLADGYVAAPIGITVEGANILTRTLITFGQGILRAHPYARREVDSLEAGNSSALLEALLGHLAFFAVNSVRAVFHSLTLGRFAATPPRAAVSKATRHYYRKLSWAAARFAVYTDLALFTLGSRLKRQGKLSGRFADVLSWLYLGLATLRRFEAEGRQAQDLPLVHWALQTALARIQTSFEGICSNFGGPLGWWMRGPERWIVRSTPIGRAPSDHLDRELAALLQQPSTARDRLSGEIFADEDAVPTLGRLERALRLSGETAELERRAAKDGDEQLSTADQARLDEAREARRRAIEVDNFTFEEYSGRLAPCSQPYSPTASGSRSTAAASSTN